MRPRAVNNIARTLHIGEEPWDIAVLLLHSHSVSNLWLEETRYTFFAFRKAEYPITCEDQSELESNLDEK